MMLLATVTSSALGVDFYTGESYPQAFTVSAGHLQAEGISEGVSCSGATTGQGSFADESRGSVALEFHGCTETWGQHYKCNSSGAGSETVKTEPLDFYLAPLSDQDAQGQHLAGVVLAPSGSQTFAEFTCGGLVSHRWTGGVIGSVEQPQYGGTSGKLDSTFSASEGIQAITQTYHHWSSHLTSKLGGEEPHDIGLSLASVSFDFEQAGVEGTLMPDDSGDGPEIVFPSEAAKSFSVLAAPSELTLSMKNTTPPIKCAAGSSGGSLGSGSFTNGASGNVQLSFSNCTETTFNSKCTSGGQAPGTVTTDSLPIELVYLADGRPGFVYESNPVTGKVMTLSCLGGLSTFTVAGTGVLGEVTGPFAQNRLALAVKVTTVEEGGSQVQEYDQTEGGTTYGWTVSVNGGAVKPVSVELSASPLFYPNEVRLLE